jgi:hypothetical protein
MAKLGPHMPLVICPLKANADRVNNREITVLEVHVGISGFDRAAPTAMGSSRGAGQR